MSVRKREWKNPQGEVREAWIVDYVDSSGQRRNKNFKRKRDADAYASRVGAEMRAGTHTPDSTSLTVTEAGQLWLRTGETAGLERTSLAAYRQHLELHIVPLIGNTRLSQLTVPMVRTFEDKLRVDRSPAMVRKVVGSLGSILSDAQERGLVAQNVVRGLRSKRKRGKERRADKRQRGRLKPGVNIPTPDEICAWLPHLDGIWRPLFLTAIFTGLRSSELRGLRWADVDIKRSELHVRQRADAFNKIGALKSETSERVVPLPPTLVNVLREWKLACPKGSLDLVFPNETGTPASHSTIAMTADVYGHLFPRGDDSAELAAAEAFLV
jgi:integrase